MLRNILIVLIVLGSIFAVIVATRPNEFRIERSMRFSAPPEAVFAQVNDFRRWQTWSPWAKLDPAAKNTFEGPAAGEGAVFKWAGNSQVGEGMMTITESRPGEWVKIKLEFLKPFAAVNTAEFTFKSEGNQTAVTWSMYGPQNFVGKAMGLIMNCDKMVGSQFEKGLSSLKTVVEGGK